MVSADLQNPFSIDFNISIVIDLSTKSEKVNSIYLEKAFPIVGFFFFVIVPWNGGSFQLCDFCIRIVVDFKRQV